MAFLGRWRRSGALLMGCALAVMADDAHACTSFLLGAGDGGKIYGRTMEFGMPLQSQLIVVPRRLAMAGTGPDGKTGSGLHWTTRYGAAGANALGLPILMDGVNEAGLAGGLLYLPELALFQDVKPEDAAQSVASYEILTYVLTSFATVAEARDGIAKIKVNRAPQAAFGMPVPLHMTLHDASGASIVVEYIGGVLRIHDNPTTVMTNAPAFDWHVTNLNNYLNLSVTDPAARKVGDVKLAPPSTGTGMLGLPGDMSSPSRFVRAFVYANGAPVVQTSEQAVGIAFHLLHNFDIPPGTIRTRAGAATGGGVAGYETTEWSSVADLKAHRYFIKPYDGFVPSMIDLARADLDAKAIRYVPFNTSHAPVDLSR